jgi:hypothetical protein
VANLSVLLHSPKLAVVIFSPREETPIGGEDERVRFATCSFLDFLIVREE